MLNTIGDLATKLTSGQNCHWGVDQCQQGQFTIGCTGSPPSGTQTVKQARVDILYGPFTDSTGRYVNQPIGVSPFLSYAISEVPPGRCSGATLASGGVQLGAEFLGLIAEGPPGLVGVVGVALATAIQCAFS